MADWRYPGAPSEADDNPCHGCHECGLRCSAGIQMAREEFERILAHLRASDPHQVTRVLEQDKTVVWFEDITTEMCLFYDVARRRCIVHPVRPLVCRLFGRVEWLPCPLEHPLPLLPDGLAIVRAYAAQRRLTFPEWCTELGLFDLRQLTGERP